MEMRTPAFASGTRVLLVDQWVETGGTMDGAIRLVERQGGIVAGIATIAMEDNEHTAKYRASYPVVTAVQPGTDRQDQCNRQTLDSFASYKPEMAFPKRS
jgi:adenine phosphoribosyltransferase